MACHDLRLLVPSLLALALASACTPGGGSDGADGGGTDDAGTADAGSDGADGGSDDGIPATCGNGMLDEGEECDAGDFGGATCADFGGESGQLSCNGCMIDTSACDNPPATRFGDADGWSLPEGGDLTDGFYALSGSEWEDGDQSWSTVDLTGDGMPDLVITNEDGMPIIGNDGGQYWWVYPNTGDGFGERRAWRLPDGGDLTDGYYALSGSEWNDGDQSWATVDLTGDGMPDLVVTNEDGMPIVGGNGGQFWWVHPNDGEGFGDAMAWDLPDGGDLTDGFFALSGSEWNDGDQSWSTVDLTGDGMPDLVITNEDGQPIVGGDGAQYWWVHPNTGGGFGERGTFALPDGGDLTDGYHSLSGSEWNDGDESWTTVDMTGDGRPDLVITNADGMPIATDDGQFWWVHPNNGDGFGDPMAWDLPDGGDLSDGFYALGGSEWEDGDESWSTTDLTGDGRPDLVITNADGQPIMGGNGGQFWWVHPNTGNGFGETISWALPPGGDATDGYYALSGSEWNEGDQSWATLDMTGDRRPDLVILNADGEPFSGPQWYIHRGEP